MVDAPEEWRALTGASRQLDQLRPVPLGDLEAVLRGYQKQGVAWLDFLARHGMGGILADEMGLGKTLQALAFLRGASGRSLIVCPSSLVFNWQREAARFTPERRVLAITGGDRARLFGAPLAEADLVITSYPLLRRDAERYSNVELTAAIRRSAAHQEPRARRPVCASAFAPPLRAHRHADREPVRDIWSLMHFLMPGTRLARRLPRV